MRRIVIAPVVMLFLLSGQCTVSDHPERRKTDEEQTPVVIARRIADKIMDETFFGLIDRKTGEKYTDLENLPDTALFTLNPYVRWVYMNGVLGIAFIHLGEYTGNHDYIRYLSKIMDFRYDNYELFKKLTDDHRRLIWMSSMYRLCCLDACGAMGASMLDLYTYDKDVRYMEYADSVADYMLYRVERLNDGTLAREVPVSKTVWLDDLYMSVPFLARYAAVTGRRDVFDFAARQVILFNRHLYDPASGIDFHAYYDTLGQCSPAHWCRANGWNLMAQAHLLEFLPEDHPARDTLLAIFRRSVAGICRYQGKNGLWHQLLDKSDSYPETSGSAMFVWAIAKGINEGWLDAVYAPAALNGWKGIASMITEKGDVENICIGTGTSTSLVYYYERPVEINDLHGLGAVIDAAVETDKLMKRSR